MRETGRRRSDLAASDGPDVSLFHTAASHVDCVVCPSASPGVPEIVLHHDVRRRTGRAISHARAPTRPFFWRRRHRLSPNPYPANRQLYFLQHINARPVPVVAGRFCFSKNSSLAVYATSWKKCTAPLAACIYYSSGGYFPRCYLF